MGQNDNLKPQDISTLSCREELLWDCLEEDGYRSAESLCRKQKIMKDLNLSDTSVTDMVQRKMEHLITEGFNYMNCWCDR